MKAIYPPVRTGQRYGRWLVLRDPIKEIRDFVALCVCDCGTRRFVRTDFLKQGRSTSCGCLARLLTAVRSTTHGKSRRPYALYSTWKGMKQRCGDPHAVGYARYGGRGIVVCEVWKKNFSHFQTWALAHGYQSGLQLDRINPDGNYEPSNCRFATRAQNVQNTGIRRTNTSGYKGVSYYKPSGKWRAYIAVNHHYYYLGYFNTKEAAAQAYDAAARKYHGEFARLNFPAA